MRLSYSFLVVLSVIHVCGATFLLHSMVACEEPEIHTAWESLGASQGPHIDNVPANLFRMGSVQCQESQPKPEKDI